ncbi:MAG: hypothetical protein ACOX9R_04340 [Armatimonadota bacterium]|jgi:hypothetical protein
MRSGMPLRVSRSVLITLALMVCVSTVCGQALDEQMQRVAKRFVEETGDSVMGVGSWMGSPRFDPLNSDFDMRLVVGSGNEQALRAKWEASRQTMTRLIREEFGAQAPDILSRTNLYPPQQLMRGVENTSDAVEHFQRLRSVPSLGHTGAVTPEAAAKYSEGLYGTGADTYIQSYERTSGRLFYMNNGRATTGLAELAHLGEGHPTYTIEGTANTCGQWAYKGMDAFAAGDSRSLAKYLGRLDRDLAKARDLSRLPMDNAFRQQLRNVQAILEVEPQKLNDPQVAIQVKRMLMRGQAEAAVLKSYHNAGPIRRAYMRVIVDGMAARNKIGEAMERFMEAKPTWVSTQNAVRLIVLATATRSTAQSLGSGDTMEALNNALFSLTMSGGSTFPPALLATITTEIMIEAEANGIVMAAGSQKPWDLMSGIYNAWGRAGVDPDRRWNRHITVQDLVLNYHDEDSLKRRVEFMAMRAATRGLGDVNAQTDADVAQAIVEECWPVIRDAWRWERDLLMGEYLQRRSEVVHSTLLITYLPNDPEPGQRVLCTAAAVADPPETHLKRMDEIIRILYGSDAGVYWHYSWDPVGSTQGARGDWQRAFTFSEPGEHPVKVRLEFRPEAPSARETEPRVMRPGHVESLVDVNLEGEKPQSGPATPESSAVMNVSGQWNLSSLSRLTLTQQGDQLSGSFAANGGGELTGTIVQSGSVALFRGHWESAGRRGELWLTFNWENKRCSGTIFGWGLLPSEYLQGVRIGDPP